MEAIVIFGVLVVGFGLWQLISPRPRNRDTRDSSDGGGDGWGGDGGDGGGDGGGGD